MSKILFINDIQLWNYKIFDWKDKETGIPVYLSRFFNFMKAVKKVVIEEKIEYIVFNGDLVEHAQAPPILLSHIYTSIIGLSNNVKEIYILLGNHDTEYDWNIHDDMMDKNYISLMFQACTNISVIQTPLTNEIEDGTVLTFMPYTRRKPTEEVFTDLSGQIEGTPGFHIFFGHIPIKDYQLEFSSSVETPDQSLSLSYLTKKFNVIVLGHYHNPIEQTTKIFTLGAPYQNSFKDKHVDRYLGGIIDTEFRDVKVIPYQSEHELITMEDFPSELPSSNRNYYRIYYDPLLDIPVHQGNILWIPNVQKEDRIVTSPDRDESEPLNVENYIVEYAKANPIGIPDEMLIASGLEIFNEALGVKQ